MVKVVVKRRKDRKIESIELSGHADSGPKGYDIVCAGVSALSIGAINAIEELLSVCLPVEQGSDGGYLYCAVPSELDYDLHEKVQLLLEGMLVGLRNMEIYYGEHIRVID